MMIDPVTQLTLEEVTDLKPFFKYDDTAKTMIFVSDELEVRVLKRFEVYDLLNVSDVVETLGLMELIIDGKYHASLNMLAKIQIEPTEMSEIQINGVPYLSLYLKHGDKFIAHTQVVQNASIQYAVYVEFIARGKPLHTMTYNELALVFDRVKQMTGSKLGVDRVLFETVVSHLARSQDDLFLQYRYTDMSKPMRLIPIRSVSYAPTSTSSRINGSYFDDGLTASLQTENTEHMPFEDLMRGFPPEEHGDAGSL